MTHPLDPLSADEIEAAASTFRRDGGLDPCLFSLIVLDEPTRAELAAHDAEGASLPRRALVWAVGPADAVVEAVVDLTGDRLLRTTTIHGAKPPLLFDEILSAAGALESDERWVAALGRRGVTDLSQVQMDPWPPGTFGHPFEPGRRLTKVIPYLRHTPTDNGYAHPIENVAAFVDCVTHEVLGVEDGPVVRLTANFYVSRLTKQSGIEFHGDTGSIHLSDWQLFDASVEHARFGEAYEPVHVPNAFPGTDWGRALGELSDAIRTDRPHRATGAQAAHVCEIIEATARSAAEGRPVEISSTFARPALGSNGAGSA